jgi:chromosome segregation ATPase
MSSSHSLHLAPALKPVEHDADASGRSTIEDVRKEVLDLQTRLEDAATECARLHRNLEAHQNLEELLKQGRAHLMDLRGKFQQATADRDRLATELSEHKNFHEREVDRLQTEIQESAAQALLQRTLAEQHEQEIKQLVAERNEERFKFEEALRAAENKQKDLQNELEDHCEEIRQLRDTSMRAQSLARQIMEAHEATRSGKSE